MIDNLRYYINDNKLLVKWNWLDVDDAVTAQCRLVKRLSGKPVDAINEFTMQAYWSGNGGCTFEQPDVPVRVEIEDNCGGSSQLDVMESPRYRVKGDVNRMPAVPGGLFTSAVPAKLRMKLTLPETIRDDELHLIDGWVFSGVKNHTERFFFPKPESGRREIISPEFEVSDAELGAEYYFEVVPEVTGTKFEDMFTFDEREQSAEVAELRRGYETIDLKNLAKDMRDGDFYTIVCPYCFEKMRYDEPVFRATVIANKSKGFGAEEDEKYDEFEKDMVGSAARAKQGKILEWDSDSIKGIAYAGAPTQIVEYQAGMEFKDVVTAVVDKYGHTTSRKVCPHCHHVLPVTSGKYANLFISMMGNTGSGKTVYMSSLINMLQSGAMLPGYNFRCNINENPRSSQIVKDYKELVEGQEIYSTQSKNMSQSEKEEAVTSLQNDFDVMSFESIESDDPFASVTVVDDPFAGGPANSSQSDFSNWSDSVEPFSTDVIGGFDAPIGLETDNLDEALLDFSDVMQADSSEDDIKGKRLYDSTTRTYQEPCIYELLGTDPYTGEQVGFILSFFDFPGEAIWMKNSPSDAETDNDLHLKKTIEHAAGLVFLFDPSSIERVRQLSEERKKEFVQYTLNGSAHEKLLTLLAQRPSAILQSFRKKFTIGMLGRLDIPVALLLSKSDAIRDYLTKIDPSTKSTDTFFLDEGVFSTDGTRKGINLKEMRRASAAIESFLNDRELKKACQDMLSDEDYMWTCVSATGVAPDENGTMYNRHGVPVHVIDPVEWIIYHNARRTVD